MHNRPIPQDNYKTKGLRKDMIERLKTKGITDKRVLEAMGEMPRHFFLDSIFELRAYGDTATQIGAGQTISHPYTVAYQTSLLEIKKGEHVLEIGTGCGYQTCILLKMGAKVFTIERQKELFDKTKKFLPEIGFNPKFFYGDGYKGLPAFAPFDKVLVTCGAPVIPQDLLKQLKKGGILIIPVGSGKTQTMTKVEKTDENEFKTTKLGEFRFVPMLEDKDWGD